MSALSISSTATGVRVDVRVLPRSSTSRIGGVRDGRLVIRVTAPPVDNAANEAVLDVLARHLKISRRSVVIVSGQTSRQKTVDIAGYTCENLRAAVLSERD